MDDYAVFVCDCLRHHQFSINVSTERHSSDQYIVFAQTLCDEIHAVSATFSITRLHTSSRPCCYN